MGVRIHIANAFPVCHCVPITNHFPRSHLITCTFCNMRNGPLVLGLPLRSFSQSKDVVVCPTVFHRGCLRVHDISSISRAPTARLPSLGHLYFEPLFALVHRQYSSLLPHSSSISTLHDQAVMACVVTAQAVSTLSNASLSRRTFFTDAFLLNAALRSSKSSCMVSQSRSFL